jgi:hypothetical protein
MHSSPSVSRWAAPTLFLLAFIFAPPALAADDEESPLHVSSGVGVFLPWDGDVGFNALAQVHTGMESDRFWVGGELEYRRYAAELKPGFEPDYNTFALRFSLQYHPLPEETISPYVGFGIGIQLSKVDNAHSRVDRTDRIRQNFSGGPTVVGVAGADFTFEDLDPVSFFVEGRLGYTTDLWVRKGGSFQADQIGGFTGMGGARLRF